MARSKRHNVKPNSFTGHTGNFERRQYNARVRQAANREIDKCKRLLGHEEQLKLL